MKIALDYDGTYTADRKLWKSFVKQAVERGHEVCFVTFRREDGKRDSGERPKSNDDVRKSAERMCIGIVFSNGTPKRSCYAADIWIEDHPETITMNYKQCRESGLFLPEGLVIDK